MKRILIFSSLILLAFASSCDLLSPKKDTNISFQDTTVTVPNGSILFYGVVSQSPLDSATLARLRKEGYTGGTDKAPVTEAEIIAITGTDSTKTITDARGRFALVLKSGRFAIHINNYSTTSLDTTLVVDANREFNATLTPLKEFIFPLAIGNKWVYNSLDSPPSEGEEIWEIISKHSSNNSDVFIIQLNGQGRSGSPPSQTSYSYTQTDSIILTKKYFIAKLYDWLVGDTIPRFVSNTADTVKLIQSFFPSSKIRYYVHRVGLVYYYANGGSPGSGRWSTSLKLRSYALKP